MKKSVQFHIPQQTQQPFFEKFFDLLLNRKFYFSLSNVESSLVNSEYSQRKKTAESNLKKIEADARWKHEERQNRHYFDLKNWVSVNSKFG